MPVMVKHAFNGGEVSPSMYARFDVDKQRLGLRTCRNMQIRSQGGAQNRAGFEYLAEVETSGQLTRLIPFRFSTTDAYVLEFGEQVMRIFKDGVLQGAPTEVATPYSDTHLADIVYSQSADVMYLTHPLFAPYKVTRTSDTAWGVDIVVFVDGPYAPADENAEDLLWTPAAISGSAVTIAAHDTISDYVNDNLIAVGNYFRLGTPNPLDASEFSWGWGTITEVTDTTHIKVDIVESFGYELALNYDYEGGLSGWEDRSVGNATVSHNPTLNTAVFVQGSTGDAILRQEVATPKWSDMTLTVDIDAVAGAVHQLRVAVGSTSGANDLLAFQAETTIGIKVYTFNTGDNDTVHINLDTNGSTASDIVTLNSVGMMLTDIDSRYWRFGAWTSDSGWPEHSTFHEQRLAFAASKDYPDTVWLSRLGAFEDFAFNTPSFATDGFSYISSSLTVDTIQALVPFNGLIMGTASSIRRMTSGNEALSASTIAVKTQGYRGIAKVAPLVLGSSVFTVQLDKRVIREQRFSFEADGFDGKDITILSDHLFKGKQVKEWAYAEHPDSTIWVVMNDGALLSFVHEREHDVWAWSRHDTGASGLFESVATIPQDDTTDVYVVVQRAIDGSDVRYVERLRIRIEDEDTHDYGFVDSGHKTSSAAKTIISATKAEPVVVGSTAHGYSNGDIVYITEVGGMTELNYRYFKVANKNPNDYEITDLYGNDIDGQLYTTYTSGGQSREAVESVSGLDHLEGETVAVLTDGNVQTQKTVSSGAITLDENNPGALIHIGIPITADFETLDLEMIGRNGTTQGRKKNVSGEVHVYLQDARGGFVGPDFVDMQEIIYENETVTDAAIGLFTGIKSTNIKAKNNRQVRVAIRQTQPLPITIQSVVANAKTS